MRSYKNYQRHLSALQSLDDANSLPKFSLDNSRRPAKIVRCVDGDTVVLAMIVDEKPALFHTRLAGIDAPEMRPRKSDPNRDAIKREARAAKEALESLMPPGEICAVDCGNFDLHGRLLALSISLNGVNPVEAMVAQGYAVRASDSRREKDWNLMWQRLQQQRSQWSALQNRSKASAEQSIDRTYRHKSRRWWRKWIPCT